VGLRFGARHVIAGRACPTVRAAASEIGRVHTRTEQPGAGRGGRRPLGDVPTYNTPNGQVMERGNGSTTAGIRSQDGEAAEPASVQIPESEPFQNHCLGHTVPTPAAFAGGSSSITTVRLAGSEGIARWCYRTK
jgi:hypothetical protein